jgi:hypothetical protein
MCRLSCPIHNELAALRRDGDQALELSLSWCIIDNIKDVSWRPGSPGSSLASCACQPASLLACLIEAASRHDPAIAADACAP